jgi:2-oxoglutarate-Fe(II)-dependent oxygenase superfamily protein
MKPAQRSSADIFSFAPARIDPEPFPHFAIADFVSESVAGRLLDWFESEAPWSSCNIAGFGSYNELNLRTADLPAALNVLRDDESMARITAAMEGTFGAKVNAYIDIIAHKLMANDTIGVHTDNDGMLSYRLILHVHRGWTPQHGGELVLHESAAGTFPPVRTFPPQHRAGLAFEISQLSFHSIQRVNMGERYTLVYGFFRP